VRAAQAPGAGRAGGAHPERAVRLEPEWVVALARARDGHADGQEEHPGDDHQHAMRLRQSVHRHG